MAGMFPTMVSDPNDRNRRHFDDVTEVWPQSLKIGYLLFMTAAVLMLVTGMIMLRAGVPAELEGDVYLSFRRNMRIVAFGNMILGLLLAGCAAFFEQGSKRARLWASALVFLIIFLNFAGFFVGVSGWSAFAIVVLVGLGIFFAFRPAANAFVAHRSGDLWLGVK